VPGYVAFLRGLNVGGHRVKSEDLRALFEASGYGDVRVFRASGNVVFTAGRQSRTQLRIRIEQQLEQALGYGVPTFPRTASEVRSIALAQPFAAADVQASAGKLQVTMLSSAPAASARKQVLALGSDRDRLAFGERELFWLPSGGILDSALDLKAIGRLLGPTTTRTKNTVEQIAAKHLA
jgi:uncharacterized protein (DUF1697 family)